MKRFEVYKNIRKRAMIFGLPVSLFALQMVAVVASLLVIIFSFSFGIILSAMVFNAILFMALTRMAKNPQLLQTINAFPKSISNKRNSGFDYEED